VEAELCGLVTGSPNVNNDRNTATAISPLSSQTTSHGNTRSVHDDTEPTHTHKHIIIIFIITDIYMAQIQKMQQKRQVNCYSLQLLS